MSLTARPFHSRSASRSITTQRRCGTPKDTPQPALLVQLPHDIKRSGIHLCGTTLSLNLEEDFNTLCRTGNECRRDSGEKTSECEFGYGQGLVGPVGGHGVDDAFAEVVAL